MKKRFLALASAALLFTLSGCGGGSTSTSSGSGTTSGTNSAGGDQKGVIKIGMVADLSGKSALSGTSKKRGAELAVEDINAHGGIGGKTLQLVIEDNLGTDQGGVSAFQKLASDQSIVAVVGSIRSTQVKAIDPYVKKAGIPVAIGGTNYGLTHDLHNKWYFRFRPNDSFAAQSMVDFTSDKLGKKKIAIIYDTDAFGNGGKDLLLKDYQEKGIKPVDVEGYTTGTKDFTPMLENIRKSGADAINTYMTNSEDAAQMVNQFRQLGLKAVIVGSPSIAQEVTLKLAGKNLDGIYSVNDFALDQTPETISFVDAYKKKYSESPDVYTGWAYDALHVLAKVISEKGTDPEKIRQGLSQIKDYKATEGTITFDENGDGLHSYSIVKVENGKIVTQK